ncbi:hypothetical protein KI387_033660 [Taxus chinensis]|uniref:Protein kinase domain-containing protein n=1 Tax=Taxus chinensis TaxID=29808 RepID=A0AA38BYF9_TAXCH|nr:hypothetical protein KI387_033660 [Taxus chinensis]
MLRFGRRTGVTDFCSSSGFGEEQGNEGVLDSGMKLRDLVQPTSSDLSKLLEGISQGAKMLTNQKFMTTKLSTEAQTVALDLLRGVGNAHWAAVGLLVIANVLDRFDKISANDRECLDLLRAMLNLGKYMKQLKDNHFDLHREILEKMSEGIQLIVSGAILCHSFIGSNKISKFLLTMKIREELVYVRGRVDEMKSDLVLQMQVLIMSTLTVYISTRQNQHDMLSHHDQYDTGGIVEINSFSVTQQGSETEMYGLESEVSSSNRQDSYNEINGHRQQEMAPPNVFNARSFLRGFLPNIFRRRLKKILPSAIEVKRKAEFELLVKKIQPSAIEVTRKELRITEALGKGGFGTVYFGTLYDGRKVAVKIIAWRGDRNDDKGGENQQIIDWHARMKIICNIIEGLVYLNEGADGCVVHRDITPRNILLDENYNAKISDFGISYILTDDNQYTHEETWTESGVPPREYVQDETHFAVTLGYIDPEYMMSGKLTEKADIYSFGILLLNIVSGKKYIEQIDEGLRSLAELAWKLHKEDRLNELIDPRLVNDNGLNSSNEPNLSEMLRTTMIALWCIQMESKLRPSASEVLRMLSSKEEIPTPPAPVESHLDYSHDDWSTTSASVQADEDHNLSPSEEEIPTPLRFL